MEERTTGESEKEREIRRLIEYELGVEESEEANSTDSTDSTATHNSGLEGETVQLDEFDNMFAQSVEEQIKYGREQGGEVEIVESYTPEVEAVKRLKLAKSRKRDRHISSVSRLFGFRGFGEHAVDKLTARKLFDSRVDGKPRWAVYGLVLLRDSGLCRVCSDAVSTQARMKDWNVVQLILYRDGGRFTEGNCVLICGECSKVWNYNKEFFMGENSGAEFRKLCFYVMRRRQELRNGALPLSSKASEVYWQLKKEQNEYEAKSASREILRMTQAQEIDEVELIKLLR